MGARNDDFINNKITRYIDCKTVCGRLSLYFKDCFLKMSLKTRNRSCLLPYNILSFTNASYFVLLLCPFLFFQSKVFTKRCILHPFSYNQTIHKSFSQSMLFPVLFFSIILPLNYVLQLKKKNQTRIAEFRKMRNCLPILYLENAN